MTLYQILLELSKKDSYELLLWLQFLATKISCKDCIDICKDKKRIPQCQNCVPAKNLIRKIHSGKGEQ